MKNLRSLLQGTRTILFDVDGTLVDSNHLHAEAWVKTLASLGHKVSTNEIYPWIGKGGDKILSDLVGLDKDSREAEELGERRAKIFKDYYVSRVEAFPLARELIELFKVKGFHVAIATSARRDELGAILKAAKLENLFQDYTSSSDAENSKPDPDIIEAALRRTKSSPEESLMIGDTPYDIEAAAKAGVRTVAVRTGGWDTSALKDAAFIFDSLKEIYEQLSAFPD